MYFFFQYMVVGSFVAAVFVNYCSKRYEKEEHPNLAVVAVMVALFWPIILLVIFCAFIQECSKRSQ
ncbi:MAG: hypothetical protein A3C71_02365 [Candidatus Yanofskybacteria bacterium RIFCSPHIGHO2_02_FULL_43_15c]|uniref:Uncharacterized protein n=2 Tax=Candidatus Yanofskyibacteriota TaxID=1752733 RepID=A0A1F8H3G0_9BACT|nr:MAG: hypothetical protein A3C71_02365 [Candidatus Yanofskybacteria bacterium RIFCSPHIGHO2_02_FULL_43_15c]OGN32117.1 MAG: hypothetical protein A3I92_00675 [Candidatus Yanofskybacteria bacterium RIFCSPLOWO2_02_FULL_43_10b]